MTVVLYANNLLGEIFANNQLIRPGITAKNARIIPPKENNNVMSQNLLKFSKLNRQSGSKLYIMEITRKVIGIKIM
jgi:hypothetical protein